MPDQPTGRLLVIKGGDGESTPSPECVALLEEALEAAKAGKMVSVCVAVVTPDGGIETAFDTACTNHLMLLAAISHLHFRLNQHIEDHHDG